MSRIYALQAPRLAAAAARMKADVNYLGTADDAEVIWLERSHVFVRDAWAEGPVTVRRLQCLYHRLFPGDWLLMDGSLPAALTAKASAYARERGARVVIGLKAGQSGGETSGSAARGEATRSESTPGDAADILVHEPGASWFDNPGAVVQIEPDENLDAWIGTLAISLMNGFDLERSKPLCRRAASLSDIPWYDEVAYA